MRKLQAAFSSDCRDKRLQCCGWWKKILWSINKNNVRTNDHIRKIAIGQSGYYTTGCLIDYPCFKNCYKLITIDLRKQQKLGADPKAIQKSSFTGNVDRGGITQMFSIIEEAKETVLDFPKEKMELKKL